jgi:hypothetical protein
MRRLGYAVVVLASLFAAGAYSVSTAADNEQIQPEIWTPKIPKVLVGPYISDTQTLMELDRPGDGKSCDDAGPLNFQCLVYRDDRSTMSEEDLRNNPFMLPVFTQARKVIKADLDDQTADHLSPKFLKFAGSKIELVGVVNRMDRQFNKDPVPERKKALACGEISAIYRFAYKGRLTEGPANDRSYQSRLPVTMNVVFPAEPWSGSPDCATVATAWRDYVDAIRQGAAPSKLRDQARRVASWLRPFDIDRIELNMQSSRIPAGSDESRDFGTKATYIIRVFRWQKGEDGAKGQWVVSYLSNQIDRARLLGNPEGDANTCPDQKGKPISRKDLAKHLLSDEVIPDIDLGLVNIPIDYLACRAVSISPGGASRSGNQPFWNDPKKPIISDADIAKALKGYLSRHPETLSFVGTPDEFRTRLNDVSCSGCHQSRAIAGFHFPGADRPGTATVNAIFLPGSAHFFGDQPRRMEIIEALASLSGEQKVDRRLLAANYAVRPQNTYDELRPTSKDKIQLLAGWGGTCLMSQKPGGVRKWGCEGDLTCQPVFASDNQPGLGMCLGRRDPPQIGEVMQFGHVTTEGLDDDRYNRDEPVKPSKKDTTISVANLPALAANSYIASHQEYFEGDGGLDRKAGETPEMHARRVLEQMTGGFPGGSLRLGQCVNLPSEATCGLLASTGFSDCISAVKKGKRTAESCFRIYTSYSGVKACDPANPCRDDYICMSPIGYTLANAKVLFERRANARDQERLSFPKDSEGRKIFALKFFGEAMPDETWLKRNDHRGVCIPPYFVFQFKADGHVVPPLP